MVEYTEQLSESTKNKIESYLQAHQDIKMSHPDSNHLCDLYHEALQEVYNSLKGFRDEFNEITRPFQDKFAGKCFTETNCDYCSLINSTNAQLSALFQRYHRNTELWPLLDQLSNMID